MKPLEPLFAALSGLRRTLTAGALASVMVLGTAACDDVLPDMDTEQGDDRDGDDDRDDDGRDGDRDGDDGDD